MITGDFFVVADGGTFQSFAVGFAEGFAVAVADATHALLVPGVMTIGVWRL